MDTLSYKTLTPNAQNCPKEWVLIDATDLVLGRLCSEVAKILRGKNKPCYSPFVECGDNVVIINADKVQLTGNKWTDRIYYNFTGYPGGQRELTPEVLMKKSFNKHLKPGMHPLYLRVVKGMLPKTVWAAKSSKTCTCSTAPNILSRTRTSACSISKSNNRQHLNYGNSKCSRPS